MRASSAPQDLSICTENQSEINCAPARGFDHVSGCPPSLSGNNAGFYRVHPEVISAPHSTQAHLINPKSVLAFEPIAFRRKNNDETKDQRGAIPE